MIWMKQKDKGKENEEVGELNQNKYGKKTKNIEWRL